MDFEALAAGRIIPPWTPTVVGSMDTSQFDMEFTSMLPVGKIKWFLLTSLPHYFFIRFSSISTLNCASMNLSISLFFEWFAYLLTSSFAY